MGLIMCEKFIEGMDFVTALIYSRRFLIPFDLIVERRQSDNYHYRLLIEYIVVRNLEIMVFIGACKRFFAVLKSRSKKSILSSN